MRKACLESIYHLAKKDKRVVFVGSDLGAGTLEAFRKEMPDRFFMEGVSEQHLIGMCAGMAKEGLIPYFNTIATFLTRRAFEQIAVDVAMHNLPVRLIGSGGGLVYGPLGPTHTAVDDIALMRAIPNMTIVAPADSTEMKKLMEQSIDRPGPMYIRLAKGNEPTVTENLPFTIGKAIPIPEQIASESPLTKKRTPLSFQERVGVRSFNVLIITTGITLRIALAAAEKLKKESVHPAILHLPTVKPIDVKAVIKYASSVSLVITIEEGRVTGGLGSAVAEIISEYRWDMPKTVQRIGIPDVFPQKYGRQEELLQYFGITAENIIRIIKKELS